jgi:ketoreductase RED1
MTDSRPVLDRFHDVSVVGAGVIGSSWAALFLAHGLRVTVTDVRAEAETELRAIIDELSPTLRALGLAGEHLTDRLVFEPDLATAVRGASLVQENGPENSELKQQLLVDIERAAPPGVLICSSSSAIPATYLTGRMGDASRTLVGHPFNPPHVIPLVEVVPGERTSPEAVADAVAFYAALGKRPQVLRREVPGFVANRLQAALFREAVHLVSEGVVDEGQLDEIVSSSIGLRWAVKGPFQTFHLGGGPGGLAHFLDHLGPTVQAVWSVLGAPTLDEPTVELLKRQAAESFGARPVDELREERDAKQLAVLKALGAER